MKCKKCDGKIKKFNNTFRCVKCGDEYYLDRKKEEFKEVGFNEIPYLTEGTVVIIENEQHPLNKNFAVIIERGHKHYKVEVKEGYHKGDKVWLPEHWIVKQ